MAYMATLGKRFQNSGLEDILIEAEVVAQGSVSGVLSGHHYNRSVRAHKLMFEALSRLRLKAFIDSCGNDEQSTVLHMAQDLSTSWPTAEIYDVMGLDDFRSVMDMYYTFVEKERSDNPTFDFWSFYIDMVQDLLCLLRGTREGNWQLHLATLKRVLPCGFFAYDRENYSGYLPAYISEMENLRNTNLKLKKSFRNGEFDVQRQDRYGFSSITCDIGPRANSEQKLQNQRWCERSYIE